MAERTTHAEITVDAYHEGQYQPEPEELSVDVSVLRRHSEIERRGIDGDVFKTVLWEEILPEDRAPLLWITGMEDGGSPIEGLLDPERPIPTETEYLVFATGASRRITVENYQGPRDKNGIVTDTIARGVLDTLNGMSLASSDEGLRFDSGAPSAMGGPDVIVPLVETLRYWRHATGPNGALLTPGERLSDLHDELDKRFPDGPWGPCATNSVYNLLKATIEEADRWLEGSTG